MLALLLAVLFSEPDATHGCSYAGRVAYSHPVRHVRAIAGSANVVGVGRDPAEEDASAEAKVRVAVARSIGTGRVLHPGLFVQCKRL